MKKMYNHFILRPLPILALLICLQFKATAGVSLTASVSGSPFCACATINVAYNGIGLLFNAGNIFTVELSDASGSFASPIVIASVAGTATTGTIVATLPCNTPPGTGYQVRVMSSDIAYFGFGSNAFTVNAAQTPSVSVGVSPNDTVCGSQMITFSANVSNGGANPTYQWYNNNSPVGTSSIYTDFAPADGDEYHVTVTSDATCPDSVHSDTITVVVNSPSNILAGSAGNTEMRTVSFDGLAIDIRDNTDCDLIATVTPAGPNMVFGNTTAKVTIDNTVNSYATQPYVQRHYDIEPTNNAATATANVTLYAYQSEFDAYNVLATTAGLPLLPTGGVDNGNIRITQFHGIGTAPGNYPGTEVLITPTVSWNATNGWWEMTFPVAGFSGFYIHTAYGHALEVKFNDITARNEGAVNRINWTTAEETSGDIYTLQHSANGADFTDLATMPATGHASAYAYTDNKPYNGTNYYRVKLNSNGNTSYTKVVNAIVKNASSAYIQAYPNPAKDMLHIEYNGITTGELQIADMTGKVLIRQALSTNVDVRTLSKGVYLLQVNDASTGIKLTKMITKE